MKQKIEYQKVIHELKKKHGLDINENVAALVIHLMCTHRIDEDRALDLTSRGGDKEYGIDGWYYNEKEKALFIYQSKFSDKKQIVVIGLKQLLEAKGWLECVLVKGVLENPPLNNQALYNLYDCLSHVEKDIKKISFILVSLCDQNKIEEAPEYDEAYRGLINSKLNKTLDKKGIRIDFKLEDYNFEHSIPISTTKYKIATIEHSKISLTPSKYLYLAYVKLHSLIELYRERSDLIFNKNIRYAITKDKYARSRLVNPMTETLDLICKGKEDVGVFTFYHGGITISATSEESEEENVLELVKPSIINGCQTINIASDYLTTLEKNRRQDYIQKFKNIKIIAKVVIGASDDELKEITNANNRQIPIDDWQLFSNDSIHIDIAETLKNICGVFYQRQEGAFESLTKYTKWLKDYPNTRNTYVTVKDLGRIICLSRGTGPGINDDNLQLAAKPTNIFLNKTVHSRVFDKDVCKYPKDMVLVTNLFKALSRGLSNYLYLPVHANNDDTRRVFSRPIIKAYIWHLALLYFYQVKDKKQMREDYCMVLHKSASSTLVGEFETFYRRVVSKMRDWYIKESKNFEIKEISKKRRIEFMVKLAREVGIDLEGSKPFSKKSIKWSEQKVV